MEQKNTKNTGRKSPWRLAFAALIFFAAAGLLLDLAAYVIHQMGGISFSVPSAASIGIIGGADGPTSVLIATSTASWWEPVIKLLFLGIGILGWRHMNGRN